MDGFFWLSLLIRLIGMIVSLGGIAVCVIYYICDAEKYKFLKCRSNETARYLFINAVLVVFLIIAFCAETSIIDRFQALKRNAMFISTFYGRGLLYIFVGAMMMPAACMPVLRTEPSSFSAACSTWPCRLSWW